MIIGFNFILIHKVAALFWQYLNDESMTGGSGVGVTFKVGDKY